MLFGNGYDETLWLMINGDKVNRDKIIRFIRSIPEELYKQIYEKILIVQEYTRNKVRFCDRKYLCGHLETDNGLLYWFHIDLYNRGLNLGCSVSNEEHYDEIFEMTLYPNSDFERMENLDNILIGNIEYDVNNNPKDGVTWLDGVEIDYELVKTPLGFMVIQSSKDSLIEYKINRVNIKKIPSEINLSDLEDRRSIKRLIRGKNRG